MVIALICCAVRRRKKAYSVRKYKPFAVAEARMPAPGQADGGKAVQGSAFRELAKFLFGGNATGTRMAMTTPVITSDSGAMQFVLPLESVDNAPQPLGDSQVQVKMVRVPPCNVVGLPGYSCVSLPAMWLVCQVTLGVVSLHIRARLTDTSTTSTYIQP